ncbi:MAG TPA: hypothetical protein P5132_09480, partial [Bacteroidales bacterium]|nr:hypothetical protein [Bacteroidales bacterium]
MRKITFVSIFILSAFIIKSAFSQVDVKLILRNPVPSEMYQWQQDPTIIQLLATNLTNNEYQNASLSFTIRDENGRVIAESKPNNRTSARFNILPMPQVTFLNGAQIIDVNSISYNISIESLVLAGNSLPEGFYEICIRVYDQYGNNITSGEEYCTNFTVLIPEPPVIISPTENEVLTSPFPTFIWTPVTSYNAVTNPIKYKLKICPVFSGQSPRMAIDNNQPLHEESDILTTSYLYLPSNLPFTYYQNIDGYVWMVQALDMNGNAAASNQGKSELGTFRIENVQEPIILANIYPADNDTIPWITPHLVAQFSPYTDDITSVNFTLHLKKDGTTNEFTNTRILNFAGGSQISQQLASADEASIIICNVDDNKTFPQWMQNLEPGVKYKWSVEAEFTKSDGSKQTSSTTETAFVIGFKEPSKMYPSKDTLVKANSGFDFKLEIPRPQTLNFGQNAVLSNAMFHAYNSYADAMGKFSIEIAKKESFDSIVQTKTITIPSGEKFKTGNDCNELYSKISKKLDGIKDTGIYFYRVNYLSDADIKYYSSPAKRFKVVPDSLITCFEMSPQRPVHNGTWTESLEPKFSVSIKPKIKKSAITGGRIRVWKKLNDSQTNANIKTGKAVLDTTFTGNADSLIYEYDTDMDGYTRYDLNFINGGAKSKKFKAAKDSTYLWNFTLNFNKDSIRTDKLLCASGSLTSSDGMF